MAETPDLRGAARRAARRRARRAGDGHRRARTRAPSCSPGPTAATLGTLGDPDLDRVVARDALGELEAGLTSTRHYGAHGEAREDTVAVFIESFAPPPRMVIFGAVDFTAALAKARKVLGYRVTVCDARAVFATPQRFPMADEVVNDWPDRYLAKVGDELGPRDAVCVLTHDAKFDVPAIVGALATDVGYLGAMGSRRTHAQRVERLREAGVDDEGLARIMAPIGLDIGGAHARGDRDRRSAPRSSPLRTGRQPVSLAATRRADPLALEPTRAEGQLDMDLGIAGKRAAVAAASQGLGLATAAALAAEGVQVAICSRDREKIEAAAAGIRGADPARRRRVHRERCRAVRPRRPRRARRRRHPRRQRRGTAAGHLRDPPTSRSTARRSS